MENGEPAKPQHPRNIRYAGNTLDSWLPGTLKLRPEFVQADQLEPNARRQHHLTPSLALRALRGLSSELTVEEFQAASGIVSYSLALKILNGLVKSGIGKRDGVSKFWFSPSDRVRCAVLALEAGCDIEEASGLLTWQDFEALAAQVLSEHGYRISKNLRLKKPRMEVDVVGVNYGVGVVIDCKHWRRYSTSALAKYCELQAQRSKRLVSVLKIKSAIPVILTLHAANPKFISGIPIVPVSKFSLFLAELDGNIESLRVITAERD